MALDFSNQRVLITGASVGLGAEFARQFHACGAHAILVARRADLLTKLVEEFNQKRPASAESIVADISSNQIQLVLDFIKNQHIDILVNNAGRGSFGLFENIPIEQEIEMVTLNISATLRLAHAVIPQMKSRRSGTIISLSSVVAFQALPYMSTYSGTKAFNLAQSVALRHELSDFGVKVITLCPGPTDTEFGGVAKVPGNATGFPRDSAQEVVTTCLNKIGPNAAIVVPTWASKLLILPSRLLPRTLCSWLGKKVLGPTLKQAMTKNFTF